MEARILVSILTFNEGKRLKSIIDKLDFNSGYDYLVVNDGSTDNTSDFLNDFNLNVITHVKNLGVGAGIRTAIKYGRKNQYDIIVIMAGNGKMIPQEIDRLTLPLLNNEADYVQGSRYLQGGKSKNLPLFRKITIKLFTFLINLFLGIKGTDITCGFRAYKLSIFDHPEINLDQEWLKRYEMEYYIHYKVIGLGFKIKEVPVSMLYPEKGNNYSKIKPIIGWWSMIRPWIFLLLKIKK